MAVTKSIAELSIDTRVLVSVLNRVATGALLAYETLSKAISRDVQGDSRAVLSSARRIVQRDYGIVFACVSGVGLKRLSSADVVDQSSRHIEKSHRCAHRGIKELSSVDTSQLTNDQAVSFSARVSHLGVIANMTTDRAIKKIENVQQASQQLLSLAQTLDAFK